MFSTRIKICIIAIAIVAFSRVMGAQTPTPAAPGQRAGARGGRGDPWPGKKKLLLVADVHDRMPAILQPKSYEVWLDPKTDPVALKRLLAPFPSSKMKSHPVSSAVNYPQNDNAALLMRVDAEVGTTSSLF